MKAKERIEGGEKHFSLARADADCAKGEKNSVEEEQLFHAPHLLIGVKSSVQVENLLRILFLCSQKIEKREGMLFLGALYNNQIVHVDQIELWGRYCQKKKKDFSIACTHCMQNPTRHLLHSIQKSALYSLFALRFTTCQLLYTLRSTRHLLEASREGGKNVSSFQTPAQKEK